MVFKNCTKPLIWFGSIQFMNHEHPYFQPSRSLMLRFILLKCLLFVKCCSLIPLAFGLSAIWMGACTKNPNLVGSGGSFKNHIGLFLLAFTEPLNTNNSLICEFYVVIRGVEIVKEKGWNKLLIKYNS